MNRLPHEQSVELAVIMNFNRDTKTEKDMRTFFIFGLSAIRRATLYVRVLCGPTLRTRVVNTLDV